jgi:hypothetical protein
MRKFLSICAVALIAVGTSCLTGTGVTGMLVSGQEARLVHGAGCEKWGTTSMTVCTSTCGTVSVKNVVSDSAGNKSKSSNCGSCGATYSGPDGDSCGG